MTTRRDPRLVMTQYRKHVLHAKRKYGSARALVHYRGYIQGYLDAKRELLS